MRRLTFKKRLGRMLTPTMHVVFRALQPLGFHITRNHFYQPIPDTRELKDDLWDRHSEPVGVDMNLPQQIALLEDAFPQYIKECRFTEDDPSSPHEFHFGNDFFEAVDAEVLHSMVRHFKPKRVIEIGSGHSTLISARAAMMNRDIDGSPTELICIEPYPNEALLNGLPGLARLIRQPVQEVDLAVFRDLDRNDILFIDSSHVAKIGSDVLHEYLEILPRLRPGVLIHIHDIFIPDQYPKEWVLNQHLFWTEQYLLQAFLAFNSSFEVLWASSFMSRSDPERLERSIPSWKDSYKRLPPRARDATPTRDGRNVWPVSFWIRRVR
jgi:predicted O-methyltransferase YrrM